MTPARKPVHLRLDRAMPTWEADILADAFHALAQAYRLQILAMVAAEPGTYMEQMADRLPITQATVCHHTRVLRKAGILRREWTGATGALTVDLDAMFDVATAVRRLARG